MKWTIDYLEEEGIVLVKTSGRTEWDKQKQMCQEAFVLAQKHNTHKFLADHTDLKEGLSVFQINNMPRMFREIGVGSEDRIAILYNPSLENKFKLFQNVSKFALLNFRLFDNEEEAIAWLKSSS
ncbi:MAG: STAS/SEC14 domain-containing protein [Sedimentisphaerales bacterium]|nr:STAS/SEC14 domain-containing protein [Sedimentisphaerales bacterium]